MYTEVQSSSVQPVGTVIKNFTLENLEEIITTILAKKDYKLLEIYKNYSIKNSNNLLKDIISNTEYLVKSRNVNLDKTFLITKISENCKNTVQILEGTLEKLPDNSEILVAILATIIFHLRKIIVDVPKEI